LPFLEPQASLLGLVLEALTLQVFWLLLHQRIVLSALFRLLAKHDCASVSPFHTLWL